MRLLLLFLPFLFYGQTKFEPLKKVSCFKHPESVCIVDENKIFVADIGRGLASAARDSDGVIYACAFDNFNSKNRLNKNFKLNAPKGMAFYEHILYVADVDRIVMINTESGEKTDEISFPDKEIFLNDVFMLDDNTLLVTATNRHELYAVVLSSKEVVNMSNKNMFGANGLCKNGGKIFVCGFSSEIKGKGSIYAYDTETNKTEEIVKDIGHLDGMRIYKNKLIISDWGADYNHGKFWELDPEIKQAKLIYESPDLKSPSGFDIYNDTLVVPCLDSGDLLIYKLSLSH